MVRVKMPCCLPFWEEPSLPSTVIGPQDLAALTRRNSDLHEMFILRIG